ncbi:MAG TPA: nitroreductase family deazaflavin-dependent oxidoreductase [Solirubrobacteraceae bacterium]|jgi:deazaflavin-dependent oxidoreductase (nitroreductase family)|nr:nitroreductase family deazaflavin-dependent oxidoreductase [Solirubrobacteraceae bacterium]
MLFGDEHVRVYRETGGREGHDWEGTSVLLLTTTGRRSGEPRTSALIYCPVDGAYAVFGSKGGSPAHPAWYLNLVADPEVTVQVGDEAFPARARTAVGAERERLWPVLMAHWPDWEGYQAKTDREVPIVVLERVS